MKAKFVLRDNPEGGPLGRPKQATPDRERVMMPEGV